MGRARGNNDLDSEVELAYELGYRHSFGEGLSVDAAVFYNSYEGLISDTSGIPFPATDAPPRLIIPSQYKNSHSAQTWGGEVAVNWRPTTNWRLNGSYSFLQMDVQDDTSDWVGTSRPDPAASPQRQFRVHSHVHLTRHLAWNVSFYVVDSVMGGAVPAIYRLDSNITWKPKEHVALSIGIQNALDPHHPEQTLYMGGTSGAGEIERQLYAQLSVQF